MRNKFNELLKSKLIEAYQKEKDEIDAGMKRVFEKLLSEDEKDKGESLKIVKPKRFEVDDGKN